MIIPDLFQPHVVCGEQLVHSPYMQCLASLAVGLQLDALLCHPPVPPHLAHCPPEPGSSSTPSSGSWANSEWAWLHCFSTTVKTAEALARGHTFPESFIVPDLEPVAKDKLALLMVRERTYKCPADLMVKNCAALNGDGLFKNRTQDNRKWVSGMDEQIMSWATSRPEVRADTSTRKYTNIFIGKYKYYI